MLIEGQSERSWPVAPMARKARIALVTRRELKKWLAASDKPSSRRQLELRRDDTFASTYRRRMMLRWRVPGKSRALFRSDCTRQRRRPSVMDLPEYVRPTNTAGRPPSVFHVNNVVEIAFQRPPGEPGQIADHSELRTAMRQRSRSADVGFGRLPSDATRRTGAEARGSPGGVWFEI
jgi:hypothetical protein